MKPSMCILTLALMLTGCGTSPEPDYYTLAPVSGPVAPEVTGAVKIQRPSLPDYLDRPEIVRQDNTYQVQIDEYHRWAEPLDTMLEHILAQDLQQRLPSATIIAEDDETSRPAPVTIALDIRQFNAIGDGQAALQAQLDIKCSHERCRSQPVQYTVNAGSSVSASAESLSELIGKLADDIAIRLRDR